MAECTCLLGLHIRTCGEYWPVLAQHQADTISVQGEKIGALIRERDSAKSDAEAAYDLAEQYATRAGAQIGRDDVLRYVSEYWRLRGDFERSWHRYQLFHWDVMELDLRLSAIDPERITSAELVRRVREYIAAVNPVGGTRRRVEEWARPTTPEQLQLGGAA